MAKFYPERMPCTLLLFLLLFGPLINSSGQADNNLATNLLSEYLSNAYQGRYVGWNGVRSDSLWVEPLNYISVIDSIGEKFLPNQSEECWFALSYSLDSVRVNNNHAVGFVSVDAVSKGYCLDSLKFNKSTVKKEFLMIRKRDRWYVLSETGDWFTSADAYIRWAENSLTTNKWCDDEEVRNNVSLNLACFRKVRDVNRTGTLY